ncbi:MAG: SGNH/GDSL hydrolase family protein [Chloroflexota bacterium]
MRKRGWWGITLLAGLLSLTISAAAQAEIGVIAQVMPSSGVVNLYRVPDTSQPANIQLSGGTFVTVIGRNPNDSWYQVEVPGSVRGWLPAENLLILNPNYEPSQVQLVPMDPDTILNYSLLWNFETTNNAVIFQRARQTGRQINGIAKIGDSITASSMFLYPFASGVYDLQSYPHLEHVLDYFGTSDDSSFSRNSMAVRNGWTTNDVLSEFRASQRGCPNGTTPLTCELQQTSPAFALIMLGTNDAVLLNSSDYETNLETIVQTVLDYNAVPVLFTSPPLLRPEYEIMPYNRAVVRVAQKYDLAIVNYWLAVQSLPNQGMSADLVHPSGPPSNAGTTLFTPEYLRYGYTVRNLVTLQGLDRLLRHAVYPTFG